MRKLKEMWKKIDDVKRYELVLASIRTMIAIAMLVLVVTKWLVT
jgi:hypothetical protein